MIFCLKIGIFQFKSLNLLYIQQISPQLIYFISISTCSGFQICGKFFWLNVKRIELWHTKHAFHAKISFLCPIKMQIL